MSQARKLAAQLGVGTADTLLGASDAHSASARVNPPPQAAEPVRGQAIRWTERRRDIFNFIGFHSLSLVATDGPVSLTLWDPGGHGVRQRIGHNRGLWPAKIVKGSSTRDAATTTWDKNPLMFCGTQVRLWFMRESDCDRAAASIVDLIAERAERDGALEAEAVMRRGFRDLGAELDLALFEMEMHGIARALGIATWDDEGLVRWFDSIGRRVDGLRAERPEIKWEGCERIVAKMAARDVAEIMGTARLR
ncbi:MAG: hypothetical protein AB7S70_02610 [Hyphomicrobium sp.]|uniref:hypothetical protein n=1 Tax=Hyphomicrobium sp. TaxID=82 RepID=UPI003D0D6F98